MAPPRSRPAPDDSKSEASSTKDKSATGISSTSNGKGRRGPANPASGSTLRDVAITGTNGGPLTTPAIEAPTGLQWSTFDSAILHGYRYDYSLNTPAAFKKPYNQLVLARSPIGRMSPTMAHRKETRRQSKDQLANAVRKHFNSMGIAENEVVVDFLYKVRWQDKNFRLRFAPQRPR